MAMTGGTAVLVHSGLGGSQSNHPIKLYVYYKTSQDISTNKSTIYCGMYITTPYNIGEWTDHYGSYVGKTSNTFTGTIPSGTSGTRWLAENQSFTVDHASDGSGKATIYWKLGVYSTWGGFVTPSGNFDITLPSIPRASVIDSLTCSTKHLEGTFTCKYTPKNSSFYNRMRISIPNVVALEHVKLGAKATSQQTYTHVLSTSVLESIYNRYPSAASCTIGFVVETYSDSGYTNKIGESQELMIEAMSFPDHVAPTIENISWTKTSNEPSSWPLTQNVSKGTMTMTSVKESYGSPIKSYSLTFAGYGSTKSSLDVPNIASSGKLKAIAKVTDSRERSFTKEVEFNVAEYSKPQLTVTSVYRSNDKNDEDVYGEYLYVLASASVSAVGDNSLKSLILGYKKRSDSTYTFVGLTSGTALRIALSSDYTWDWTITATDKINSVSTNGSIPTGEVVLDILANGRGIGLGKVAEKEGLDSAWDFSKDGVPQVDYVVEQGSSGDWEYRKWASGRSEAWIPKEISFAATPNSLMGGYYASKSVSIPSGIFKQTPSCLAMGRVGTGIGFAAAYSTSSINVSISVFGNQNSTTSYITALYAIGLWK